MSYTVRNRRRYVIGGDTGWPCLLVRFGQEVPFPGARTPGCALACFGLIALVAGEFVGAGCLPFGLLGSSLLLRMGSRVLGRPGCRALPLLGCLPLGLLGSSLQLRMGSRVRGRPVGVGTPPCSPNAL